MAINVNFIVKLKDEKDLLDKLKRLLELHEELSELIPEWNYIEANKLFNEILTILSELIEIKAEK